MNKITITTKVNLEHMYLNKNFRKHLIEKIVTNSKTNCTQTYGHIIEVDDDIEILSNKITRTNSDIEFEVRFNAMTLKPLPDNEYECKVCMIYKDGIFLDVLERQQILVPKSRLKDYVLDKDFLVRNSPHKMIKVGDSVRVRIIGSKFTKNNFHCFGDLIE